MHSAMFVYMALDERLFTVYGTLCLQTFIKYMSK